MKIKTLFFVYLLTLVTGLAQEKRIVIVSPFTVVKIFSGMEVKLIPSEENKVIVYGDYQQGVIVQQKGETLKIKQSIASLINKEFSYIEIYSTEKLYQINAHQRSKITATQPFEQDQITLKVREGSELTLDLACDKIKGNVSTGGRLYLEGKTQYLDLKINSGGSCEAEKLKANNVSTQVVAGGVAYVNATALLEAKVTGGGIVRIFGKPKKQITQTTLGGKIVEVE
ncbi:MAG: GIN domain-containing protein [Flavobacteriaceae bacterium]